MNKNDAFLLMTSFAYFWAVVIGLFTGLRFEKNLDLVTQTIFYAFMCGVFLVAVRVQNKYLFILLGWGYVLPGMLCWGGLQDWGGKSATLLMSCWDLAISVVCLSKVIFLHSLSGLWQGQYPGDWDEEESSHVEEKEGSGGGAPSLP